MTWFSIFTGKSGFAASSTAEDVTEGVDGTGVTSGIGLETARVLAFRGVHVVMPVRNLESGKKVKESIVEKIPNAQIEVMELDVSSLESVRQFVSQYCLKGLPLNILILNAGIKIPEFTLSKDHIELNFATNHVGNFLLTNLLLDTMKNTATESGKEGRIVIVSSEGHRVTYKGGIMFDKLNDKKSFSSFSAYGQSKLANVLHANKLTRRLQGAATTCYVALNPQLKGVSGKYFSDSNLSKASEYASEPELVSGLKLHAFWHCCFINIEAYGLTAIITGPTSGIGLETACILALRGVHVVMAVTNITY